MYDHLSSFSAARLFQSREELFGKEPTDYDALPRIRKLFEPYANLWGTTKSWAEKFEVWTQGSFLAIEAEALEADVERYVTGESVRRPIHAQRGQGSARVICCSCFLCHLRTRYHLSSKSSHRQVREGDVIW